MPLFTKDRKRALFVHIPKTYTDQAKAMALIKSRVTHNIGIKN
jgi:hypothetical protein